MIYNPYRRIREQERIIELTELARLKAEDECRVLHSLLTVARESECLARKELSDRTAKFEDWMASLMGKPSIHGNVQPKVKAPDPARRPIGHGADVEREAMLEAERALGIEPVN